MVRRERRTLPGTRSSRFAAVRSGEIEPVFISKANAEQQRAIDLCIIFGFRDVAGMGKVPRA